MSDLSKYSDEDIISILTEGGESELRRRGYDYGWYKKAQFAGAIYVLVNPAFPNLVKIGYADDVEKRMKSFNSSSGLPDPYHCYAIYKVRKRLEDLKLHSLIDTLDPDLRHAKNREFYEMDCQKAYDILSAIAQINGDEAQLCINPFSDRYFDAPSDSEKLPRQKLGRLKFSMIGIPVGSTLVFSKDPSITCVTKDAVNKVEYQGSEYPISALAAKLCNVSAARGGAYFMYNGELLTEIRKKRGV